MHRQTETRESRGKSLKHVGLYASTASHIDEAVHQRLIQAGCQLILTMEQILANSPSETPLWTMLNPGDTVIVVTVADLARSLAQLAEWLDSFAAHGVTVKSLTEDIDTSQDGDVFRAHVHQLAQWERAVIQSRTRAGMEAAREQGKLLGRPRRLTAEELAEAERRLAFGETKEAVARALGVSRSTLYRAMKNL